MREETFGPVIALVPFDNQNDVVAKINASEFGLSASVWSKDLARADNVARALEVGAVSINNVMLTEGNPALPFGGCKQSGFGRVKGVEGLRALVRSKAIIVDKQTSKIEANWFPYTRLKYRIFDQFIKALSSRGWRKWFGFARHGLQLESVAQKRRDEIWPFLEGNFDKFVNCTFLAKLINNWLQGRQQARLRVAVLSSSTEKVREKASWKGPSQGWILFRGKSAVPCFYLIWFAANLLQKRP